MNTSSLLSMVESRLPPGFRFHPQDDELICDYLSVKLSSDDPRKCNLSTFPMMIDIDLNKCEPWDLPEIACVGGKEWYFFSLRDRKYATGQRTNRATMTGYWKATGKDRTVVRKGAVVGMRKTLVFYEGRAPKGKKTDWVMHEFRMERPGCNNINVSQNFSCKEDWVLCRVFYKSRGISTRPINIEKSYEINSDDYSSPPPLMENYISFDQNPLNNTEGFEQVPCFSNYTNYPNTNYPNQLSEVMYLNPFSCTDKKMINTILNQLTKLDGNSKREVLQVPSINAAQVTMDHGNSFDVGLSPVLWNPSF